MKAAQVPVPKILLSEQSKHSAASQIPSEPILNYPTDTATLAAKQQPKSLSIVQLGTAERQIIIAENIISPDRNQRITTLNHLTIKPEPDDSFGTTRISPKHSLEDPAGRPSKIPKVEAIITPGTKVVSNNDYQLAKLKKRKEQLEQEIEAAQRAAEAAQVVAELLHRRREEDAEIAALE